MSHGPRKASSSSRKMSRGSGRGGGGGGVTLGDCEDAQLLELQWGHRGPSPAFLLPVSQRSIKKPALKLGSSQHRDARDFSGSKLQLKPHRWHLSIPGLAFLQLSIHQPLSPSSAGLRLGAAAGRLGSDDRAPSNRFLSLRVFYCSRCPGHGFPSDQTTFQIGETAARGCSAQGLGRTPR